MSLFDKFSRSSARRAQGRGTERAAYDARLLAPQWEPVEARLGHPVPGVLRALYADRALITSGDMPIFDPAKGSDPYAAWNVHEFIPADEEALFPEVVSIPASPNRI